MHTTVHRKGGWPHLDWVHAMHGGTLTREALPYYLSALRTEDFGYRGMLLGRELAASAAG